MERLNNAVMEKGPLLAGLDPDMDKLRILSDEIGYAGMDCDFYRFIQWNTLKQLKT